MVLAFEFEFDVIADWFQPRSETAMAMKMIIHNNNNGHDENATDYIELQRESPIRYLSSIKISFHVRSESEILKCWNAANEQRKNCKCSMKRNRGEQLISWMGRASLHFFWSQFGKVSHRRFEYIHSTRSDPDRIFNNENEADQAKFGGDIGWLGYDWKSRLLSRGSFRNSDSLHVPGAELMWYPGEVLPTFVRQPFIHFPRSLQRV
jgi:hypothetical protein